jgi:dipeptide/tripeptide permease
MCDGHRCSSLSYYVVDFRANIKFGGNFTPAQVECVKYVVKLFPFLVVMIPYWGIYSQTKTAFQVQGCQMDLNMAGFELPVSAMNIFNNIAILTLVPLFDQVRSRPLLS